MGNPDEEAARLEAKQQAKEARKAARVAAKKQTALLAREVQRAEAREAARAAGKREGKEAREAARAVVKREAKEAREAVRAAGKREGKQARAAASAAKAAARVASRVAVAGRPAVLRRHPGIVEVNQPMLLITQVKRSGGVILSRLFDSHPGCFTHPRDLSWDPDGGWPSFAVAPSLGPAQAFGLLQDEWIRRLGADGYSYKYAAVKHRAGSKKLPYPFVFNRKLAFDIFADRYRQREPGAPQRPMLNAYLTALFNAWLDYQNLYTGPKRWVTCLQAPLISHPHGVEDFFSDYPDGRLLTIVRHPAAWLPRSVGRGGLFDLEVELAPWQVSTRGILDAVGRYGDRVVVLLFDDLVLRTEATLRALCAQLGMSYDPVLRKPTFNSLLLTDTVGLLDKWRQSARARDYLNVHTEDVCETLERTAIPQYEEARHVALVPHV